MENLRQWLCEERGRAAWLAGGLGITQSAINQWDRVPVERVLDIERLTGIARQVLRPDVYPEAKKGVMA